MSTYTYTEAEVRQMLLWLYEDVCDAAEYGDDAPNERDARIERVFGMMASQGGAE